MSDEPKKKESAGVKFLKILLVILIPLVFVLTVTTLFLKLSGFNINQEVSTIASKVPVLSSFVGHSKTATTSVTKTTGPTTQDLNKTIDEKNKQIANLQKQISSQQSKMKSLTSQITSLKKAAKQSANATQNKKAQEKANVIAMTFQAMDPAKAAAIFEKMTLQQAADDLNLLNNQTKAKIMEQLSPDTAAKLTPLLTLNPYPPASSSNSTGITGTSSTP